MVSQRRPRTGPRTKIIILYDDMPAVELSYPRAYTAVPELLPRVVEHVLETTRPELAPEVEYMLRSLKRARDQGASLRRVRPGDRLRVGLDGQDVTWERRDAGWQIVERQAHEPT